MENTIYLADSKFAPYGNRPRKEIVQLSIKNTEKLIEMGAKIIVVACNTATTNAISILRANYELPFVGIEPAIKPAALKTKTGRIGILATRGTLSSALFSETSEAFAKDMEVVEVVGEGLVPLIENGQLDSPELHTLLTRYVKPMIEAEIDYLVLGCSHYPYLIPKLKEMLPEDVTIIDSGAAVARQTKYLLEKHQILREDSSVPSLEFYSNAETTTLKSLLADHAEISVQQKEF